MASPASALTVRGTRMSRASGSGRWKILEPPSPYPTPDPRLVLLRPREPPSSRAGRSSSGVLYRVASGERADAPPGPGALGQRQPARRRGDYFPRPLQPRPLSSRGGTLRAAPVAAGYSGSCATYKRSLCGAILSFSVCNSRVRPAARAESEGRRRRRNIREAAPVPAEPPPQAEDDRTPAAGGACSPEVLGRSFPYPFGAAPVPSSEPNFVAGARSRRWLRAGPGAAGRPGVGSGLGAPGRGRARGRRAVAGPGFRSRCSSGALGAPLAAWGPRAREGASGSSAGQRGGRGVRGLWFPSGAPAAAEFGGGTLRLGMCGGRSGGRGGAGDSAFPPGSWGTDAGPGTPP